MSTTDYKFASLHEFIKEIKIDDWHDPWGTGMLLMFEVCHIMWWDGENIPAEWQYRPGAAQGRPDYDGIFSELLNNTDPEILLQIGEFLKRYLNFVRRAGRDY